MQGEKEEATWSERPGWAADSLHNVLLKAEFGSKRWCLKWPLSPATRGKQTFLSFPEQKGEESHWTRLPCSQAAVHAPEHSKTLAPAHAGPHVTPQINPSATAAPSTHLPMRSLCILPCHTVLYPGRRGQTAVGDFMLPYLLGLRANLVTQGA